MKYFEYDRARGDPKFIAVMRRAAIVFESCNRGNCVQCPYHRAGTDNMLAVCFTEKLADSLIDAGLIDAEAAAAEHRKTITRGKLGGMTYAAKEGEGRSDMPVLPRRRR